MIYVPAGCYETIDELLAVLNQLVGDMDVIWTAGAERAK